jgi:hypothetical protein
LGKILNKEFSNTVQINAVTIVTIKFFTSFRSDKENLNVVFAKIKKSNKAIETAIISLLKKRTLFFKRWLSTKKTTTIETLKTKLNSKSSKKDVRSK